MRRMHWDFGQTAKAEALKALADTRVASPQTLDAYSELRARLDHLVEHGEHPHELTRQAPLRAISVIERDDVVVYAVFVQIATTLWVLHVSSIDRVERYSRHRPPLPPEAWEVARARYEAGRW